MKQGIIIAGITVLVVALAGIVFAVTRPPDTATLITRAMEDQRRDEIIDAAEAGHAWAMKMLYLIGDSSTGKKDKKHALELMKSSASPTARYFHFRLTHKKRELNSLEGKLLRAQFVADNLRMPMQTDEEYSRQSYVFRSSLDSLRAEAERGDEDARWVLARLDN